MEEWKVINEFNNYEISNLGQIRSIAHKTRHIDGKMTSHKSRILKQQFTQKGYLKVRLTILGVKKTMSIHRVVAEHFLDTWDSALQVNHIDGVKTNNTVSNLEMVTNGENQLHAYELGLHTKITGEDHHFCNHSDVFVKSIMDELALAEKTITGRYKRGELIKIAIKLNTTRHIVKNFSRARNKRFVNECRDYPERE